MDHTETLWVIFLTQKRNLLTKISSLKKFGSFKVQELKVQYGKKPSGGWTFRTPGAASKVFSFHDGDVVIHERNQYRLLRTYSGYAYLMSFALVWLYVVVLMFWKTPVQEKDIPIPHEAVSLEVVHPNTPQVISNEAAEEAAKSVSPSGEKTRPDTHEIFLKAKKDFDYGRFSESSKSIKKNMDALNPTDQHDARNILGEIYYLQCQNFLKQHEERKAVITCEKAVSVSNHTKASIFLDDQDKKARSLYLEAYTVQGIDHESAKQKYVQVLQAARSKSTWRSKAQYQLNKLKKQNT